jgi:hypothetical protein
VKLRFIEYKGDLYVSLGITYNRSLETPECFVCAPINAYNSTVYRSILDANTINIPIDEANEVTNKSQLIALMVLYGL